MQERNRYGMPKKWSGKIKSTPASLYTHVQVLYTGRKGSYRIPLENWTRRS